MQFEPAPARCDGVQGKVCAMRLELNAGRGCGQQSAAIPVEILFLMNMSAQEILHPREFRQHSVQRGRVGQGVSIKRSTARRQWMMMKQQQRMTFRFGRQFGLKPVELKVA